MFRCDDSVVSSWLLCYLGALHSLLLGSYRSFNSVNFDCPIFSLPRLLQPRYLIDGDALPRKIHQGLRVGRVRAQPDTGDARDSQRLRQTLFAGLREPYQPHRRPLRVRPRRYGHHLREMTVQDIGATGPCCENDGIESWSSSLRGGFLVCAPFW